MEYWKTVQLAFYSLLGENNPLAGVLQLFLLLGLFFRSLMTFPYQNKKICLGIQSRSYKDLVNSIDSLIEKIKEAGMNWVELWIGHFPLELTQIKAKETLIALAYNRISVSSWGVIPMGKDEAHDRQVFLLGQIMGIKTIGVDPVPESLEKLSSMASEYHMNIAIHNKGSGHRWGTCKELERVFSKKENVGICVDTGHFLSARVDPLEVLEQFRDRIFGIHLKDVSLLAGGAWRNVALGQGSLELEKIVRKIYEIKFSGYLSLEYERDKSANGKSPDHSSVIRESVKAFEDAVSHYKEPV